MAAASEREEAKALHLACAVRGNVRRPDKPHGLQQLAQVIRCDTEGQVAHDDAPLLDLQFAMGLKLQVLAQDADDALHDT